MKMFLPVIFIAVVLSMADAEDQPREIQRLSEDPQMLLPQTSRHSFAAVNPVWRKSVSFQRLRPDAFINVEKPSAAEKKSLYNEIRYFAGSTHEPNDAVKILTYHPNGKLYSEIDKRGGEQFTRRYFSDGTFADFTHWQAWKWIAGVAIDPKTGKENHFSEGTGSLTTHDVVHDSSTTNWYQNGRTFLEVRCSKSHRTMIKLYAGEDSLIVSKAEEHLQLESVHEYWARKAGDDPWVQIVGTQINNDIPQMHGEWWASGPRSRLAEDQTERQRILEIWKAAYEKRRSGFLGHCTKILTATGHSWQSLDMEFISANAPWPEH